ncbi:MAG: glycosyltransferase [Opitutaceae bacterium]|nr:glycosyltransferase [Opitutaceae bacterium]
MPAPLLLDLSHTSHTRARTGIQRVARSLLAALGDRARPITHDPHARTWRGLEPWEHANLAAAGGAAKRGASWPLHAKIRGRVRRLTGAAPLPDASGLVVPEVFSASVAAALPSLLATVQGPRVAIFHDAIALKFPELAPVKTVGRFPAYLIELLAFDGIAAISDDSNGSLADYWAWLGVKNPPPIRTIPLGMAPPAPASIGENAPVATPPVILSVGSIEGRKNHRALLEACESRWAAGDRFSLRLIGLAHVQTGAAALARLRELQAAGRPLRYDGPVGDADVARAYAECAFTVYPSLIEGFGLPVIESVAHGKPCVCSARGALGESAAGGGCVALDRVDAPTLAETIARLLRTPAELTTLAAAARARRIRTWGDYALDLTTWMAELPRR